MKTKKLVYPKAFRVAMLRVEREVLGFIKLRARDGRVLSYMGLSMAWSNAIERLEAKHFIRFDQRLGGYAYVPRRSR